MAETILQRAMSPEVIDQSWQHLRNERTPWSIEINRDQLQQHLLQHILTCRENVLNGTYRPQPLRQFPILKPNGRQRVISAQYLQDKLVQRALLIVLEPRAEAIFHDDSYAYRPHRNVKLALNKVRERVRVGQDWLVDADIKQFFDSIPHKPLLKRIKSFVNDARAMKLIEKWIKLGTHHSSFLTTRRGISQGAILSPLFCNLYLHQFDIALTKANISFVRFADDFLLFAKTKEQAMDAMQYAEKQLGHLGLSLHPEKTRVARSHPSLRFLGQRLPKPAIRENNKQGGKDRSASETSHNKTCAKYFSLFRILSANNSLGVYTLTPTYYGLGKSFLLLVTMISAIEETASSSRPLFKCHCSPFCPSPRIFTKKRLLVGLSHNAMVLTNILPTLEIRVEYVATRIRGLIKADYVPI